MYFFTLGKLQLGGAFFALVNLSTPAHEQYCNAIHQTRIANHRSHTVKKRWGLLGRGEGVALC